MAHHDKLTKLLKLFLIALGVAIYTFGFVNFNMANALAEGGVAGITLILHAHFGIILLTLLSYLIFHFLF
ncbi:putative transporter [Streptococcus pyogenes]|nr:putative transporter [Streptococcus pyogenes]